MKKILTSDQMGTFLKRLILWQSSISDTRFILFLISIIFKIVKLIMNRNQKDDEQCEPLPESSPYQAVRSKAVMYLYN